VSRPATLLAVAALLAVYLAVATGLELARRRGRPISRELAAAADLAVVATAAWLAAQAGQPGLCLAAAAPVVAVHAWSGGRPGGRQAGGLATALVVVTGMGAGHHRWVTVVASGVAVALVAGWLTECVVRLAETERDAAARSLAIDRFRKDIVTTVSHELRTPLAVILGLSATLTKRWDRLPEPERLDLLDAIGLNVASLDSSVLHFIDAGRLERGEWGLDPRWVDVEEVVAAATAKLAPVLAGHQIQLALRTDQVWADAEAVGRILELLLANAARFAPIGTPITIRAIEGDGRVELAVIDRGPGIPAHQLPHVFEPFWRADVSETGISRGAGLGLAIVRQLAEQHGGIAQARSSRGRGTTVLVELPGPAGDPRLAAAFDRAEAAARRAGTSARPAAARSS
jgi:signal transduction histidine kinase